MREVIFSKNAPAAVGPYSQAISTGDLVFTSGQIPIDPRTGKLVQGGIEEQTRQVLENLKNVLIAAGTDLSRVIKATVFLEDISHFSRVNEIYSGYFATAPPARTALQVAALPLGAMVEMEAIAISASE